MSLKSHFAPLLRRVLPGSAPFLCIGLLASTAFAAGQTTNVNVTTIVHDYDTAAPVPNLLLIRSDDYNGSGQATYTASGKCPSNCLTSQIGSGGAWTMLLLNQSLRTICFTFVPVTGSSVVPSGCYYVSVEAYSRCLDASGNVIGFLAIAPGTSINRCSLGVDFSVGRTKYKLEMGQTALSGPATGWASVSCNAASGTSCYSWTIVPNTVDSLATIANLYQFGNHGLV